MPHISIKMIEGRSEEQKQLIAKKISDGMNEAIGCGSDFISIEILEYSPEKWQKIFADDIENNTNLYQKPNYNPKVLLK